MRRGVWAKRKTCSPEMIRSQGTLGDYEETKTSTRERRKGMEEFSLTGGGITDVGEKSSEGIQAMLRSESLGFWKRFLSGLKASFNAPFESDWEKRTGIHWKDWGKL